MDPGFVERHWDALPNLKRLRDSGYFGRLGTTTPPQSPVAWSTLITGLDPGQHGIFDFVHRDPSTLLPFSSLGSTKPPRFTLPLGPFVLPLSSGRVVSLRHGTAFWKLLYDQGVDATVIHMPTNYPPVKAGKALSGMGTPDLQGTLGTFTFFTDDPDETSREVDGGRIVRVRLDGGRVNLHLTGPPDTLRKDDSISSIYMTVNVDQSEPVARFELGGELAVLKEGEWSDWLAVDFPLIPHLSSVRGTVRIFVKQLFPGFQIYVSAVNADPMSPALPVANPSDWGRRIALETGRFYTLGTPEDTSALRQNVLSHDEFRGQTKWVFEEERRLFQYSLRHYKDGLLFFYFSSVDQNSHVLWERYESELLQVYRAVDECIGETRQQIPDAALIVMSDHGFTSFKRAANLNTWLKHRGFLTLNGPPGDDTSLSRIDWQKTKAYGVGLNGLYLNLQGREARGLVAPGQAQQSLMESLRQQLLGWRDPVNGGNVVSAVYNVHPSPPNSDVAPDLIVGYNAGYRASWQTGIGGTPVEELEDNREEWIGDHCVDPALVPGVLFTSSTIKGRKSEIKDVTATILHFFRD